MKYLSSPKKRKFLLPRYEDPCSIVPKISPDLGFIKLQPRREKKTRQYLAGIGCVVMALMLALMLINVICMLDRAPSSGFGNSRASAQSHVYRREGDLENTDGQRFQSFFGEDLDFPEHPFDDEEMWDKFYVTPREKNNEMEDESTRDDVRMGMEKEELWYDIVKGQIVNLHGHERHAQDL